VVRAPALRYAPGLSLSYREKVPEVRYAVFSNGDWFGAVRKGEPSLLAATAAALPYALAKPEKVLVLDAGTGTDVTQALANGAEEVRAVEPHKEAVRAVAAMEEQEGHPLAGPGVSLSLLASRTWLALDTERYDLVILPDVGTFGGSAGLLALQEQYLLTREAFREIWRHLDNGGMLRVSAWIDSPPRATLRLAATIAETLEEEGAMVANHVMAVRGWDMLTFLVKRSPFTTVEVRQARSFCERLQFDPVLLPGSGYGEGNLRHQAAGLDFSEQLETVLSGMTRERLYGQYAFNLRPATDNRPFFSQFLRLQSLSRLGAIFGRHALPFLELGYILVLISFVQMLAAAALLILLPLLRLGLPGHRGVLRWTVPYFSGLGLGYMFFEMVMIHELVYYFGHPILAAAAVISTLLIFSGLGSLFSGRLANLRDSHALAAATAALLLLLYFFILQPLLHQAVSWPQLGKILFFLLLMAPPSFVMGMPFPLGLSLLAGHSKSQAAWAWGINGSVSVVSTALATIIAVEVGFTAVMLSACAAYLLASVSGLRAWY
jgi:hypothetical protein